MAKEKQARGTYCAAFVLIGGHPDSRDKALGVFFSLNGALNAQDAYKAEHPRHRARISKTIARLA